jgi:hypothetical protein
MDFDENTHEEMETEFIPIIPSTTFAQEENYPISPNAPIMQNGFKSVSNSRLSNDQQAALEDPQEKDILELLQQMDEFEPIVKIENNFLFLID